MRYFGLITPDAQMTVFVGWALGNGIPSFVLGVLLLKYISPLVIKTRTFCKGYWA